jgi:hypothetical protein
MSEIVIFESGAQPVEVRLEGETLWLTGVSRMRCAYPPDVAGAQRTAAVAVAVGRISEAHPPKAKSETQEPAFLA